MTTSIEEIQPRFAALFAGRDDALGFNEGRIERRGVTTADWLSHLRGETGIGMFPLRDDGTVRFAAIDLDEPNFELAQAFQMLLPGVTWLERSRSGNAHVWAFFAEPVEAWVARGLMRNATEALDRKDVEIFPKQSQLLPGMIGNYINLPYHGDSRTMLMRSDDEVDFTGPGYTLWGFVEDAHEALTMPESWRRRAQVLGLEPQERRESDGEFGEQPFLHDCAKHIIANKDTNPVRQGTRSAVLFHLAVQLLNWRDLDEDEAKTLVDEVNAAGDPPLPERELNRIFRNAASGRYTFTGCDDPLMADYVHPDCPFQNG